MTGTSAAVHSNCLSSAYRTVQNNRKKSGIRSHFHFAVPGDLQKPSYAAAAPAPWMAATIIFADAEIVRIGKSCLKRKGGGQRCVDLILGD